MHRQLVDLPGGRLRVVVDGLSRVDGDLRRGGEMHGSSAACPADAFAPSTTVCRASAGACDVAEKCTGSSGACPADALAPARTVCRAHRRAPATWRRTAPGARRSCPADALAPARTVCRASAGACDVAEECTGSSASCPADVLVTAGTVCRASAGAATSQRCAPGARRPARLTPSRRAASARPPSCSADNSLTSASSCNGQGAACPAATTTACTICDASARLCI